MDLLDTMYKVTWLGGNFNGAYAYRGTQRIGFINATGEEDEDGNEGFLASVNWIYSDGSATESEMRNFASAEEAKEYVETQWKIFVDAIMED